MKEFYQLGGLRGLICLGMYGYFISSWSVVTPLSSLSQIPKIINNKQKTEKAVSKASKSIYYSSEIK